MMLRLQNIEILLSQNKFSGLFCFFFNPIKFAKISCAKFAYRVYVCLDVCVCVFVCVSVCVYVCNAQTLGKIKPFSDNPRQAMPFQTNLDKWQIAQREREGTICCLLHWSPKFYNNVFLFFGDFY